MAALLALVLTLPFASAIALAQPFPGFGTRPLSVPAKAGTAVIRLNWRSEFLPAFRAVAGAFPAKESLDINYDDRASFGRFCDRDAPYHVVVQERGLTDHDKRCQQRRFPAGVTQPEAFLVGHLRVVFVTHKDNPIESLDFAGIRKALSEAGKTLHWQDIGGVSSAAIHCCGPAENTWARQLVQDKCMTRWRDADTPGVRELQRLAYRGDLASCTNAKEVIAKVRADRHALGFFACCEPLTKRDLQGVKVLPVAEKEGSPAVAPPLGLAGDQSYPLSEPVCLYVHPNAPPVAREFCKFATGAEAAKIVQEFGLWPEYLIEQERVKQRIADVKAGRGAAITACDLAGGADVLKDLALEFVKAEAAVQLKFQKGTTQGEAVEKLDKGMTELLLMDGPFTEGEKAKVQGEEKKTAPRGIELGRMAAGIIVHPENPLESLPLDEAKAVFSGRIRNWPAAKGAGAPIRVVGLGRSDPITRLVKEVLAPDAAEGPWKYTAQADTAKVILAVARDPAAIGFVDMSRLPPNEKSVRAVRITATERRTKAAEGTAGGPRASRPHESQGRASQPGDRGASESETREIAQLMPPRADALPEDYPLARTLTLYVSPKASQVAKDFADFLTPEHCKEIIARYNLLPPLRAEAIKLAGRPHPNPLPKGEGTRLALADEPIPLLLDAPDAPQDQPEAKDKKTVAKAKPEATTSEQPEPADPMSDAEPVAASEPASKPAQKQPEASSLSDKEIVWIVCGVGGAVILAIGIGWLQAPNRKKPRRAP